MAYALSRSIVGLLAVGLAMLGCGSSSATGAASGGSENSRLCAPGHQVACGCSDGSESAKACKADGSGYLACICGIGGAGASGESGAAGEAGATSSAGAGGDAQ
ncbi:MAG TPA: hypothetical protein VHW01_11545 [Polyangiaceae bacterium]|nr:hypothetical protein [Polyangiaceae bacterium]